MKKRIGNDFQVAWMIKENGVAVDLSTVTDLEITTKHSRIRITIEPYFKISNGIAIINFTKEDIKQIGIYYLLATYRIPDANFEDGYRDVTADIDSFEIVPRTDQEKDIVNQITSDIAIGFKGDSAFQVWLDAGNAGTEADFFDYLQQPAADMIASLNETNEAALTAEGLRTTAESIRLQNEQGRVTAEGTRQGNEIARVDAENERDEAEALRLSAETTRGQNEQGRINAEGLRVTAEQTRQTNTATAITNANNAATNANTKAGLADTAANNANTKAALANDAASNANTKAGLADTAATNADAARLAIASELALKVDKSSVKQVIGTSTTDVMSQKIVSDLIDMLSPKINMAIDGHSFVGQIGINPQAYLGKILPYSVNTVGEVYNGGIGGTNLPHLLDNASTVDSKLVTETATIRNVLIIYSLNVSDTVGSGTTNYNMYKQYLVQRAAAGWEVFVYTLAPGLQSSMGAQWVVEKDSFNNLMRTDLVLNRHIHVLDVETVNESLVKSNVDFYYDGVHPTEWLGYLFMKLFQQKAVSIYGDLVLPKYDIPQNNIVARYVYDDLTTITKDASNKVSVWKDKYNSGRDLLQATASKQPLWSEQGILFVDDALKATFTLNQPETIYIVFEQLSWTLTNMIFDGVVSNTGSLSQATVSPSLRCWSGVNESSNNTKLPLNTLNIVKTVFNGSESSIKVGITNKMTYIGGTNGMGGITIGSTTGMTSRFSNIRVKEIIIINYLNTDKDDIYISEYLRAKYNITI